MMAKEKERKRNESFLFGIVLFFVPLAILRKSVLYLSFLIKIFLFLDLRNAFLNERVTRISCVLPTISLSYSIGMI